MRYVSFGLLALSSIVIAGCSIEAGSNANFPPLGGATQPVVAAPDSFLPSPEPTEEEMTASLSDAVDAALGATPAEEIAQDPALPVPQIDPATGESIASDDGILNLALQSQEEQRVARDADAAALAAAAAQRVIIAPSNMPDVIPGVNIIAYARSTTNNVGERIIRRPFIRRGNNLLQCNKFDTQDDAQRNFLANGGPQEDPLNLDPDGDGFACRWSPEPFRALNLN